MVILIYKRANLLPILRIYSCTWSSEQGGTSHPFSSHPSPQPSTSCGTKTGNQTMGLPPRQMYTTWAYYVQWKHPPLVDVFQSPSATSTPLPPWTLLKHKTGNKLKRSALSPLSQAPQCWHHWATPVSRLFNPLSWCKRVSYQHHFVRYDQKYYLLTPGNRIHARSSSVWFKGTPPTTSCQGGCLMLTQEVYWCLMNRGSKMDVWSSSRKRVWPNSLNLVPSLKETDYSSVAKPNESLWETDIVKLMKQGGHQTEMALIPARPMEANQNLNLKCLKVTKSKPKDNQPQTAN